MGEMGALDSKRAPSRKVLDGALTCVLWGYFTVGFVVAFAPRYVWAAATRPRGPNRELAFQRLNHRFCRGFFTLARWIMPGYGWRIDPQLEALRGAVIVCNHRSYLDPLMLIALYARHKTIVKTRLLAIPIFGRMLAAC